MQRAGHSSPCTRANKCQSFSSNHFNWRLIWQMSNIPMHYLYQWLFSYIGGPCPVLYKTCLLFLFLLSVLTIFCHQASWTMWYERLSRLTTREVLARLNGECWWGKLQNNQRKRIWQKLTREEKNNLLWTTSILYSCRWSTISRWRWSRRAPRCTSSLPRASPVRRSRWGWWWG